MKLSASFSNFVPAPEGTTQGVLCDIEDLGLQEDRFNPGKMVHQMRFYFQTEDLMEDGKPFVVRTPQMKASTNNKSNAYKYIKTLLGRELEAEDFDGGEIEIDELLIGKNAMVTIVHNEKDGKIYANIDSIGPVPAKIKDRLEVRDYVRVKDREPSEELEYSGDAEEATVKKSSKKSDDDINF